MIRLDTERFQLHVFQKVKKRWPDWWLKAMDSGSMDSGLMESRSTSDSPDSEVTILCFWVKPYPHSASLHLGTVYIWIPATVRAEP